MKLYTLEASRYASRCLIQMSAKGIECEVETLAYPLPEGFRAINPLQMVPVLDIDGLLMPESQVICEYLEDLGQGPSLRPANPLDCARMRLLIRLFELYYDPIVLTLFQYMNPAVPRDPGAIAATFDRIRSKLDLIASHLDGGKYAVGGKLSLADCALMPPFLQATVLCPALGFEDFIAANKTVATYFAATREDPHVARILTPMEPYLKRMLGVAS